jgi:hypothetical protein
MLNALDVFKELLESSPTTRQPEMTFERAETIFVKQGGVSDLCKENGALKREIAELKQQLALRSKQLEKANEDRTGLRRELSGMKDNYDAMKQELKRKRSIDTVTVEDRNEENADKQSSKRSRYT